MYRLLCTLFFTFLFSAIAFAQNPEPGVLQKDSSGRFFMKASFAVDSASHEVLYKKAKTWLMTQNKTSRNQLVSRDATKDSLRTVSFLSLDNTGGMSNQLISYMFRIAVADGTVYVSASNFLYDAYHLANHRPIAMRLERMDALGMQGMPGILGALGFALDMQVRDLKRTLQSHK